MLWYIAWKRQRSWSWLLAICYRVLDKITVVEKSSNSIVAWTSSEVFLLRVLTSRYFVMLSLVLTYRLVTLFSSAVPNQLIQTASRNGRPRCFSSFWTVCGKSFVSSLALLNSTNSSSLCSLNMLTLHSLGLSWETTKMKGWWGCLLSTLSISGCSWQKRLLVWKRVRVPVWSPLAQVSCSCCSYVVCCSVGELVPLRSGTLWLQQFVAWSGTWISFLQVQANTLDCLFCFHVWPWKISTHHQFI